MQRRSQELRAQATQIAGLGETSAMRACIFCCEEMHNCEYSKGVQLRTDTMVYVQTKQWETLVMKYSTTVNGPRSGGVNTRIKSLIWNMQQQLANKGEEELWGFEIRRRVKGYLQLQLIERGLDWVYPLGGLDSRAGTAYACTNRNCRAIPIQSNMWYRVATRIMKSVTPNGI